MVSIKDKCEALFLFFVFLEMVERRRAEHERTFILLLLNSGRLFLNCNSGDVNCDITKWTWETWKSLENKWERIPCMFRILTQFLHCSLCTFPLDFPREWSIIIGSQVQGTSHPALPIRPCSLTWSPIYHLYSRNWKQFPQVIVISGLNSIQPKSNLGKHERLLLGNAYQKRDLKLWIWVVISYSPQINFDFNSHSPTAKPNCKLFLTWSELPLFLKPLS